MSDTTGTGTTPAQADRPRRRRGFQFPLLLIVVGGLFFAANFGYLPPISARALLALWPLLLVIWGIEIIVGRQQPYLALVIELLIIVAGIAAVVSQPALLTPSRGTSATSIERAGARALSLRIDGGGGSYSLAGGASALVDAHAEGEMEVTTRRTNDSADVRIKPADQLVILGGIAASSVDVRIASDVPASLRLNFGAGDLVVDLRDILVRDARVDTGASKLIMTLPIPTGDVPVRIGVGAASVEIVVPDGVEAQISVTGGLVSTNTLNPRIVAAPDGGPAPRGRPSLIGTSGYASAKDRVTVTIEAGASSITIR
jgi:hypothetical protein